MERNKGCDRDGHAVLTGLRHHVERLSVHIGERHLWEEGTLDRAADYIESVFRESGYAAVRQSVPAYGEIVSNVLAEKEGAGQETVVVGAHYDTVPGSPGADDNASAVAVLLETARLLRNIRTDKYLLFAAYVNEESPCYGTEKMGSMVHARYLREQDRRVAVMVSLEMLGYFRKDEGQTYPFPIMRYLYPRTADFLAVVGNCDSSRYVRSLKREIRKHVDLPVRSLVVPSEVGGINRSDNASFWKHGFRAVMLTDTASYRNRHYHQETDTIDTLNFEAMSEIVRGLSAALQRI